MITFSQIWDLVEPYPPSLYTDDQTCCMTLLLGNQRVEVGRLEIIHEGKNDFTVKFPDFEEFLAGREYLDDGTLEWVEWGTRLN